MSPASHTDRVRLGRPHSRLWGGSNRVPLHLLKLLHVFLAAHGLVDLGRPSLGQVHGREQVGVVRMRRVGAVDNRANQDRIPAGPPKPWRACQASLAQWALRRPGGGARNGKGRLRAPRHALHRLQQERGQVDPIQFPELGVLAKRLPAAPGALAQRGGRDGSALGLADGRGLPPSQRARTEMMWANVGSDWISRVRVCVALNWLLQ